MKTQQLIIRQNKDPTKFQRAVSEPDIAQADDKNNNKFTLSFSSETPSEEWYGTQILEHSETSVDLSRLQSMGVVLYNHNVDNVIGKITKAWIEDKRGKAEIEFDTDGQSQIIAQKVRNGTLKGVSVSGIILENEENNSVFTAKKWQPFEISIVSIPADATVGVSRSLSNKSKINLQNKILKRNILKMAIEDLLKIVEAQQEIMNKASEEGRALTDEEKAQLQELQNQYDQGKEELDDTKSDENSDDSKNNSDTTEGIQDDDDKDDEDKNKDSIQKMVNEEFKRRATVGKIFRQFGFTTQAEKAEREGGITEEEAKDIVIKMLQKNYKPHSTHIEATIDERDKFIRAATDALIMRSGFKVDNPAPGANAMRGLSLQKLAIQCLSREGENVNTLLLKSPEQLFEDTVKRAYNPTAAFPSILESAIQKSIVQLYEQTPTTFQNWVTEGTLPNFKATDDKRYLFGGVGYFDEIPENGEFRNDIPQTRELPQRQLKKYGKQFSMTFEAFVNDDIDFLTYVPGYYATMSKKTINKYVYDILFNNPKIYDGKTLFSADHHNTIDTGSEPSVDSIQKIMLLAQTQKDQFGNQIVNRLKYLITGVGYQFKMQQIFGSQQRLDLANKTTDSLQINPLYNNSLSQNIIEEPYLNQLSGTNACPWFGVSDPLYSLSIQVDYLNGDKMPTFKRYDSVPGKLGIVWDIYHCWGVSVVDHRGIYRNIGTKIAI